MNHAIKYLGFTVATVTTLAIATQVIAKPNAAMMMPPKTATMKPKPALAAALQGKPVLVDIYASWCPACKSIAPTLSQVKQKYDGKVNFVVFDVSDRGTTKAAQMQAKQLGLSKFYQDHKSQTGLVAIINPATGAVIQEFRGNDNLPDYQSSLDQAIKQVK
jgi:thiol-disulfide isomerase/thioredoxin